MFNQYSFPVVATIALIIFLFYEFSLNYTKGSIMIIASAKLSKQMEFIVDRMSI